MTERPIIYLPPSGFGFFYLGGYIAALHDMCLKNNTTIHEHCILRGSSGGAIACVISLLKDDCLNYTFLRNVAKRIEIMAIEKYGTIVPPNIKHIVSELMADFLPHICIDKLNRAMELKSIQIQITKYKTVSQLIPLPNCIRPFEQILVTPRDINHLIHLVGISSTLPFISRDIDLQCNPITVFNNAMNGDHICCQYLRDGNGDIERHRDWYFDGGFADIPFCGDSTLFNKFKADKTISCWGYRKILGLPNEQWCTDTFHAGYSYHHNNKELTEPVIRKMVRA